LVSGSTLSSDFDIPGTCFPLVAGVPVPGTSFILRLDASGATADGGYLPLSFNSSRSGLLLRSDSSGNLYAVDTEDGKAVARKFTAGASSAAPLSLRCVGNAGHLGKAPVAPGEIVALFGNGLGPVQAANLELDASGHVAKTLGNTQVLFDGVPAPLLYA